jgi:transient receptor potential cation channel subfamily C protein 4
MYFEMSFILYSFLQVRSREKAIERHETVMRLLVRRYVTAEQRKRDDFGITEDDVMEIRQDISTLRFEIVDILRNNGMKTPTIEKSEQAREYYLLSKLSQSS